MKAHVDLSIFASPTEPFGLASGELDFEVVPRLGEIVSFSESPTVPVAVLPKIVGFSFQFRVENVIHAPRGASFSVMLLLEPAMMQSFDEAAAFAAYLEQGFGLGVDPL